MPDRWSRGIGAFTAVGLAMFAVAPALAQQAAPTARAGDQASGGWPETLYNPQPAEGDVVLPMPCGGAMVFRPVFTPSRDNWLSDTRAVIGDQDPTRQVRENTRIASVAGGFSDASDPGSRHYYIGKYEVLQHQVAAMMGPDCPAPLDDMDRLPVERASWFDAVTFSRAYSAWLIANAGDSLPNEDGQPGYLRLPMEVEWEYAARGGAEVPPAVARARTFPMDAGGPMAYAWVAGTQSCYGYSQPVGQLKPNPLGLYDMLGNVSEITFDLFSARTPSTAHGQMGGFQSKGGSCETDAAELRTAARSEYPFFNSDGTENHPPFTGYRLVIAAPTLTSLARMEAMKHDFATAHTNAPPAEDPVDRLRQIAKETTDAQVQDELGTLAGALAAEMNEAAEKEARTARMALANGALLMRAYRSDDSEATRMALLSGRDPEADFLKKAADLWAGRRSLSAEAYASLVVETAENYPADLLESQEEAALRMFSQGNLEALAKMAGRFRDHCERFRAEGADALEAIKADALVAL